MPRKRRDKLAKKKRSSLGKKVIVEHAPDKPIKSNNQGFFYNLYDNHYKALLLLPLIMLILAMGLIGFQYATTGEFLYKGVSLKGGVTLTVLSEQNIDVNELEGYLSQQFQDDDISARSIESSGSQIGVLIEASINSGDNDKVQKLTASVADVLKTDVEKMDYSLEVMGSALGDSFFQQTFRAIIIAFIFMGVVVWYYFRIPVPSAAVILAAFSDMVVTLAIVNLMNIRLSTAGIAGFLMLIGYSVDTDILLSTRALKNIGGTVLDRILNAMKTGLTMSLTTMSAVIIALVFSESDILKQIMTILLIGLFVDIINTWLQNAGILRWYLEKHKVDIKKLD